MTSKSEQSQTESEQSQPQPRETYGYCSWHQGNARGVRLIRGIEQGSGAGGNLFACPSCREAYDLVPLADQP